MTCNAGLGITRSNIVLFGQSIGGGAAVELATRGWGERGLVLLSAFSSLPKMVDAAFSIASPALWVCPGFLLDHFGKQQF